MRLALALALLSTSAMAADVYISPSTPVVNGAAVSTANPMPVSGSFSSSLGGFTPSAAGARMTATTIALTDTSVALPTGAVVIVSNVGTTNPMYCNVNGVAATTSDQLIPANSWFAFTIPAAITTLHCIATGGTTTANGLGGSGLPTGAGGGGGGTIPTGTAGSPNASVITVQGITSGTPQIINQTQLNTVGLGSPTAWGTAPTGNMQGVNANILAPVGSSTADTTAVATTLAGTAVTGFSLPSVCAGAVGSIGYWQCLVTLANSSLPAGGAIIGKVGIDQTTPGTTNRVSIDQTTNGTTNNVQATPPLNVTPNDCSGTITSGGTAQALFTATATKHGFTIVWRTTTEPGWISFTGTAASNTSGSFPLTAPTASTFAGAGSFTTPPGFGVNTAVSIFGATTGDAWSCTWW